jgi:hypothetical protein
MFANPWRLVRIAGVSLCLVVLLAAGCGPAGTQPAGTPSSGKAPPTNGKPKGPQDDRG